MRCGLCGKEFSVPATHVTVENVADKYLNRKVTVCCQCAYALLQKMLELDPLNRKCNTKA